MERLEKHARAWGVEIESMLETPSSVVAFGSRGGVPMVLKVVRRPGDEWRAGEVLQAFGGRGMARLYEQVEGAMLLERLRPATPLAAVSLAGGDDEATDVLAGVIARMAPLAPPPGCATVERWGRGFARYLATGDSRVPRELVESAQRIFLDLCATQREPRLLHGDLQHDNVLLDAERGWLAIDPKGVVGELEYEVGAALRNPFARPELFAAPRTVERRVRRLADALRLDGERVLAWGFAQAVLSALWSIEDGEPVAPGHPALLLAEAVRPMLA